MLMDEYYEVEEGKRSLQFKAQSVFAHSCHVIVDLHKSMSFAGMVYIQPLI